MSLLSRYRQSHLRFPLTFLFALAVLLSIYYCLPTAWIEKIFVHFFAVLPGGILLDWLTPTHTVTAEGTRIVSPLANLNVLKGCEGTEALLILCAGLGAALRPFSKTLWGLLLGALLVFVLNQARIAALFFLAAYHRDYFELVHGFLAPIVILLAIAVFFLFWLKWSQPSQAQI